MEDSDSSPAHGSLLQRSTRRRTTTTNDRSEIARYDNIIKERWGCTAHEVLPVRFYNPTEELSEDCIKVLCKLAEATDYPTGKQTIIDTKKGIKAPYLSLTLLNAALASYISVEGSAHGRRFLRVLETPSKTPSKRSAEESDVCSTLLPVRESY